MTKNDEKINAVLEQIKTKKNLLGKKEKLNFTTNGVLEIDGVSYNLNVLHLSQVLELAGILLNREKAFNEACALFEIKSTFEINKYPVSDWLQDLKKVAKNIQRNKLEMELHQLESTLRKLKSNEAQTADKIIELESLLSSLGV